MEFVEARRILQDARQKVALAASVTNDVNNMVRAVSRAGYRPDMLAEALGSVETAMNALERSISLIDQARG